MSFGGFVKLGKSLETALVCSNAGGVAQNADATPQYRIYGVSGVMSNGSGNASFKDQGSIQVITPGTPVSVESAGHKLTTGTRVTITNVVGTSLDALNGNSYVVTVVDPNNFTLDSTSIASGTHTPNTGQWVVSGLYSITHTLSEGDGFDRGETYLLVATAVIDGSSVIGGEAFTVI